MWPFGGLLSADVPVSYQAYNGPSTLTGSEEEPDNPRVILRYDADGGIRYTRTAPTALDTFDIGEWSDLHPNETNGASYSVRVTFQSGDNSYVSGSGLGVWVTLGSNRSWTFENPDIGFESGDYLIELSDDGGSSVLDSQTVTINLDHQTP